MNTELIKLRRLVQEEVEKLGTTDDVYVSADMEPAQGIGALVLANLAQVGSEFEGGYFDVETIFGDKLSVGTDAGDVGIWMADENGTEMPVLQSAGLFVKLGLFIPDASFETLNALYDAIRESFGAGVVQKWNEDVSRVPDVTFDVYEVLQAGRGRKPADGPKRTLVDGDVYRQYVEYVPIAEGHKREVRLHKDAEKKIPTI